MSTGGSYRSEVGAVGRIRIQYGHVGCSKEFSLASVLWKNRSTKTNEKAITVNTQQIFVYLVQKLTCVLLLLFFLPVLLRQN